ncbi:CNN1 protein, partial [Pomatostomus ruficeps]|nr:CNN1 protein [Pomatostomus ruficeps]
QLAQKYDPQHERELRAWIESTTGRRIGDNFMDGLKDGVILCELINKLQPGSVPKVNEPVQNWHKLENIGNFLRAITRYGVKPHDIFEANDLFENTNHTQVQSTLIALASQGTGGHCHRKGTQGMGTPWRHGDTASQVGTPWGQGDTATLRGHGDIASPGGHRTWGHRDRTGRGWSPCGQHGGDKVTPDTPWGGPCPRVPCPQAGMTAPGTKRQIFEPALGMEHCDTMTIGLQMGSNKGASQQGMTVYGLPRQVYDPKYCGGP